MNRSISDREKEIQEAQYKYPYHYIPRVEDGRFSQVHYWSWGLHYLGGIKVVLDQLSKMEFTSLLDVGCGDGRFLRELRAEYPEVEALGVDYSEKSIALANAMNPDIRYEERDILRDPPTDSYDVVTAIEVLEHIEPGETRAFVEAMVDQLSDEGHLLITVPHKNKSVSEKHYQHFDTTHLQDILSPHFSEIEIVPFDQRSLFLEGIKFLLGWRGEHYVINTPFVLNKVYRLYERRWLYADSEKVCRRIAAFAKSRSIA